MSFLLFLEKARICVITSLQLIFSTLFNPSYVNISFPIQNCVNRNDQKRKLSNALVTFKLPINKNFHGYGCTKNINWIGRVINTAKRNYKTNTKGNNELLVTQELTMRENKPALLLFGSLRLKRPKMRSRTENEAKNNLI